MTATFGKVRFGANGVVTPMSTGIPPAMYPGAVATNAQLTIAVDRLQTRLAVALGASDNSMTVLNGAGIVANVLLTIDDEIVQTQAGAGNIWQIIRGRDGTTPALHLASSLVSGFVDAWHHNALVSEIQAIQNTLGPNLSKVPTSPFVISSAYNFTPQTPGGNLVIGANVVTLSPVPPGVNGNDTNHYLYISGGTGTPEAARIIGGTAISGAPTGTVIIQCANTHSGAWSMQSATAGVQEATNTLIPLGGGQVIVPAGSHNFYGTYTAPSTVPLLITGMGAGSVITVNQTTGTVFKFDGYGFDYRLTNLRIKTPGSTPQNVTAIDVGASNTFVAEGLVMNGFGIFFLVNGPTNLNYINRNTMTLPYTNAQGIYFPGTTSSGNTIISNNTITSSTSGGFTAGIYIVGSSGVSGLWISRNNIYQASYGVYASGTCGQVFSTNNAYQNTASIGLAFVPGTGRYQRSITSIGDNFETGLGIGIQIGGQGGTVDSVAVTNCNINIGGTEGIIIAAGATNTTLSNCIVSENSQNAGGLHAGLLVLAGVSKWQVTGGLYGPSQGNPNAVNTQSYGIQIAPGASDYYSITGAFIPMNVNGTILDGGTGLHKVISGNLGIDTDAPVTISSAASITVPSISKLFYLSGAVAVTTINGGWIGRQITIIPLGTLTVGGGGNIPLAHPLTGSMALSLIFDGVYWY